MSFPIKTTTHECLDEVYAEMLYFVANAQTKRLGVSPLIREDRVQDIILHFYERDLRKSYRTDKGTKFSSYVTTCVSRHLYQLLGVAAYKVLDPEAYVRQRAENEAEGRALEEVEKLRELHGDRVVDCILASLKREIHPELASYNPWSRSLIIRQMIQNLKVAHDEEEAGSD